jgi:hypothetical protein
VGAGSFHSGKGETGWAKEPGEAAKRLGQNAQQREPSRGERCSATPAWLIYLEVPLRSITGAIQYLMDLSMMFDLFTLYVSMELSSNFFRRTLAFIPVLSGSDSYGSFGVEWYCSVHC